MNHLEELLTQRFWDSICRDCGWLKAGNSRSRELRICLSSKFLIDPSAAAVLKFHFLGNTYLVLFTDTKADNKRTH